jgi:predicted RecB family nuclease
MMNINDISKEVMTTENPLPYHYAQQLPKDLKQFMVLSKKIGTDAEIEVPFKKDLDAPHNKFVVGFMDMIIKRNDEYWILDFKTTKEGKFRKTMQTVVNDLQLMCYTWVVSEMYNVDPSKIKAGLYYLQGGSLISAKFSKQTLENVPKKLLKVYNEVMESNPDTVVGTVGDHCGLCEYKSLCSYFQNSPLNVL